MNDQIVLSTILPIIMLLAMGIATAIGSRLVRLSPIVGYIVLGFGLREFNVGQVFGENNISLLANLGVIFLLFDIGLHFSLGHIRDQAKDIFAFGPVQVLFATAGLGAAAFFFGNSPAASLLIGAILALSSTAVVGRLISERHQQTCPVGLTATSILVFQDVAAIFLLIVVTALQSGGNILIMTGIALVKAIVAFGVAVWAGRYAVKPMLSIVARTKNEEVFTAVALVIVLAAGWATGRIGLSLTLGAFLGGLALSETPYRHIIQSELSPFRGLLLGFFFIFVGYSLDVTVLMHQWFTVLGVAVLMVSVKIITNIFASRVFKWSVPGSTQLGFLLAQGSEFAFVILSLPAVRSLLGQTQASVLVAGVALSMAATPNLAQWGRELATKLRLQLTKPKDEELTPKSGIGPVMIVGMGDVGRAVADALTEFNIEYCGIERDQKQLENALADGYNAKFGDATDSRMWQSVTLGQREVSLLTRPDTEVQKGLSDLINKEYPNLKRFAVVDDDKEGQTLADLGITPVLETDHTLSENTIRAILKQFAVPDADVTRWLDGRRVKVAGDHVFSGFKFNKTPHAFDEIRIG